VGLEKENASQFKSRIRLFVVILAVIILHTGAFAAYYYFLRPEKNSSNNGNPRIPTSREPGLLKKPATPLMHRNVSNSNQTGKPKIYSWIDDDGIKHFSNTKPEYNANNVKTKDEFVSDKLVASEIIARRINPIPSQSRTTRVVINQNRIMAPVRLGYNGAEVQTLLVLDTGATTTTIHREVSSQLNLWNTKQSNSIVADGRTIPSEIAILDYIIVGPHKINNFKVTIIDYQGERRDSMGLLGMNFLKIAPHKINFGNSTITWAP